MIEHWTSPWGRCALSLALGLLVSAPAMAAYKCVDASGRTTYQQAPCNPDVQRQSVPSGQAAPAKPSAARSGPTVDDLMRAPTPGLANAPACVKAYDAELSRQWELKKRGARTDADQRKLAEMRASCPDLTIGSPATAEQRARDEAQTKAMLTQERGKAEAELNAVRSHCATAGQRRPRGEVGGGPSPQECQKEIARMEGALQRMPR